jgi:uncharacterized membrane protein YeaQ/YmgE (transglycosylase-associated protein family)
MPEFTNIGVIGWIIVGFLAGALSGLLVRNRAAGGCLANIVIGILGGIVGGFLVKLLAPNTGYIEGWIGAFVVALVGAVVVRWLLGVVSPLDRRR